MTKTLNKANYQKDKYYPAVVRGVAELLAAGQIVTVVDLLMRIKVLEKSRYEDWRMGRVPYLERVCVGSLGKLGRILRILAIHAEQLKLKPSPTVYRKWGKGARFTLRFSKSGQPQIEAVYSRHYLAGPSSQAKERNDGAHDSRSEEPKSEAISVKKGARRE